MLSVHFNGEIVRHRDIRLIQHRIKERYSKERRCKYGIQEIYCYTWQEKCIERPEIKKLSEFGMCNLCGSDLCPARKKRKQTGNEKKTYKIDWSVYRKLSSAAHYMIKEGEHKTIFITLSFPQWKTKSGTPAKHKLTKSFYYDEITNKLFSKFAENLRENYKCSHYCAVKEFGKLNNRVHFHLLACIPFVDFRKLNRSWNNTIKNHCFYSNNALQSDKNNVILRNPARAVRYVCKYFVKTYGRESETRIVFISNNTLRRPVQIKEIDYNHIDLLKQFKGIRITTYEHVTVFKITEPREFNKFCIKFLYPLFECSVKKSEFHYQNTDYPPG